MDFKDMRDKIHRKTLKLRSIQSLIESPGFERLWEESNEKQREEVLKNLLDGSRLAVVQWMRNHPSLDLGERNMEYLRQRGKVLRIKNYSRLMKSELIREIKKHEQEQEGSAE
jgi:hypothetical protein